MYSLDQHGLDPSQIVPWLFERVKGIPSVTWDESIPPVHSSYGDWHIWGTRPAPDTATSRLSRQSSPNLSSRPPLSERASDSSQEARVQPATQRVVGRVSRHTLSLERQYQLGKNFDELDPSFSKHVRVLELFRLPARQAGEDSLCLMLCEYPGDNYLRDIANCGPNYYSANHLPQLVPWKPELTANGNNKVGQCSLLDFLDFAIGACEACELLHRRNQFLHGELRPDSFSFDRESRKVKLLHYGSRVQSFEQGLTSAGWSALSQEFGVEYKLQFVSPEQTGRLPASPDLRTDIYALGIIFYNVLSGALPNHGRTALEIMTSLLNRKFTPVSSKRLDVPDPLCHLVQKMVQKNIEDRYHSDSAIIHDLKRIKKLLVDGDGQSLKAYHIAETDVNCYFTLPNLQVGREEEKRIIHKVIDRVSKWKRNQRPPTERQTTEPPSSDSSTTGSRRDSVNPVEDVRSEGSHRSRTSPMSVTSEATDNSQVRMSGEHEDSFSARYSLEKRSSIDRASSDLEFRPPSSTGHFEGPKSILKDARRYKRTHKCEMIAISGGAGLGKSSLIASIQGEARSLGYVAASKFDQVKTQPFEGVLKLMSSLFRQIFSESDVNTDFHNDLRSFVRPVWHILQGKSMLNLPEWLLGSPQGHQAHQSPQPPQPSATSGSLRRVASQSSGQNPSPTRFRYGLRDGPENPTTELLKSGTCVKTSRFTAIYLDVLRFLCSQKFVLLSLEDLQNADNESLDLISTLVQSRIPLVLIVTFRDKTQLPRRSAAIIQDKSCVITPITLEPLNEEQISAYVEATIHRSPEYVFPLVAVIWERTNGNPFFLREMLEVCYQKGCIWYSWDESQWKYDLDKIFVTFENKEYGSRMNNDFILTRLREFPEDCRTLLSWASLLGSTFSFPIVKELMLAGAQVREDNSSLKTPFGSKADLVRQSSHDAVKALQILLGAYIIEPGEEQDQFRFCHDRFQQSATTLSEPGSIPYKHFRIAQLMLRRGRAEYEPFETASHICKSVGVVKSQVKERKAYRDALVEAADKTIDSGGRAAGLTYFTTALDLLPDEPWNEKQSNISYSETLNLYTRTAEAYWYQGQTPMDLLQAILDNGREDMDKAPAWILQSRIYARKGDNVAAFQALKTCLAGLGINIPNTTFDECDKKFFSLLRELSGCQSADCTDPQILNKIEHKLCSELTARPLAHDATLDTISSVLTELLAAAFWTDHLLFYQISLVEFDIHLNRGTTTHAPLAYVHLATCAIIRFGMMELAVLLGEQARKLFERFENDPYTTGRGRTLYYILVGHFSIPIQQIVPSLEDCLEAALSSGERATGIMTVGVLAAFKLWASQDLNEVETYCSFGAEEVVDWKSDARGGVYLTSIRQFCRALQGKTRLQSVETIFCDAEHDTKTYLDWIVARSSTPRRSKAPYLSILLPALVLFGHYEEAATVGEELNATMPQQWSVRYVASNRYYISVAYASILFEQPNHSQKDEYMAYIRESYDLLTKWGRVNNANFFVWSSVLCAMIAEFETNHPFALQSYEKALDHAELFSMTFEQAQANELFGEFLMRKGARRPARHILRDSVAAYRRISAFGKADQIESKHEWLLKGTSTLSTVDAACQTTAFEETTPLSIRPQSNNAIVDDATKHAQTPQGLEAVGLDMIDLTSILEASTIMSSELNIDRLLAKMTTIIRETASAELCALVVKEDDTWVVAAISDGSDKEYPTGDSLDNVEDVVGKQITLYTLRSSEPVFLNNVYEDERFSNAPESYKRRNPDGKAVICHPIVYGNQVVLGAVYLEGPPHSFAERNMTVLRLLVSSISASIKNAMLFKRVEKVSQQNASMLESQRTALSQARESEKKAKSAEAEALRNVKLKEEAARAKSLFLANVSHELRTPLNGVIGLSELLKNSNLDDQQEDWCQSIRVCGDTLLQVINDILDFSKLEAGKMQIFAVPLSLTETISEVVRAIQYSYLDKEHIEIILDLELDKDLLVIGDPVRLHQILMNLLSNSFKFTSRGHIKVSAKIDHDNDRELGITCSVADTGVGITEEQRKKLFLPFSQADSSTARSFGGTGLGLSICKGIIENVMKGKIWLESEPGVGTKVSFSLTFAKTTGGQNLHSSQEVDPMSVFSPSNEDGNGTGNQAINIADVPRDQLRVCIAEDNAINAKIAVNFVQKLGFKCEAFGDGRLAVDALVAASEAGNPFHICLMDCQMPNLDGYDATREIRNHTDPHIRGLLVIAMTASAIRGDREKCLEAGMNNYLAKPVRQQVLKQMLEGYLRTAQDSRSTSRTNSPAPYLNGDDGSDRSATPRPTTVPS